MSDAISTILPDDFEGRRGLIERFQDDPLKAMKAYSELDSRIGGLMRQTRVPESNATPEEWKEFHAKVGVPSDPTEYAVPESKDPTIVQYLSGLRDVAAQVGIPKAAFEKLAAAAAAMGDTRISSVETEAAERSASYRERLKELYGAEADQKTQQAQDILVKLTEGDEAFQDLLAGSGVADHPSMTGLLVKIGEIVSEDSITGGLGGSGPDALTPQKMAERAREILSSGDMEDRKNPQRRHLYAEYVQILSDLEKQGFDSVHDQRLMPPDPFAY